MSRRRVRKNAPFTGLFKDQPFFDGSRFSARVLTRKRCLAPREGSLLTGSGMTLGEAAIRVEAQGQTVLEKSGERKWKRQSQFPRTANPFPLLPI